MTLNTRALAPNETPTPAREKSNVGRTTEETIRVNALMFLNEMTKPVHSPHESGVRFLSVPRSPAVRDRLLWQEVRPWQILLMPTNSPRDFFALELLGDVVLGSNDLGEDGLDINLAGLGGYDRGVSRRHLLLRPTREKLYVIDLHSTNGTSVNGMPSPVGEAHPLRDGDLLSLGQLHLQFKISHRPEAAAQS